MSKELNGGKVCCCEKCDHFRISVTGLKWCAIKDGDRVSEITDPTTILPDCPLPEFKEDDAAVSRLSKSPAMKQFLKASKHAIKITIKKEDGKAR